MEGIQWGEIRVTIEKIEDPNVLNKVLEHYNKAKTEMDEHDRCRVKAIRMLAERNKFFEPEKQEMLKKKEDALENELNRNYNKEIFDKKMELLGQRMGIVRESNRRWDEIYGREYDMIFERGKMALANGIRHLEDVKRALSEVNISNDKTKELEEDINRKLPNLKKWEEGLWDEYYARENY